MMVSNSCSRGNAQQALVGLNQPEKAPIEITLTPSTASALFQEPVSALVPTLYIKKDLQRITKFCIDSFLLGNCQEESQESQPNAQFLDLYYEKSYIEYYHFCQQYKDYFDTAITTGLNRTSFANSFLCGRISFRWYQYKCPGQVGPLPWINFKAFFQKNLSNS